MIKNADLKCGVCYCEENGINLADIMSSVVAQWAEIQKHEKHGGKL